MLDGFHVPNRHADTAELCWTDSKARVGMKLDIKAPLFQQVEKTPVQSWSRTTVQAVARTLRDSALFALYGLVTVLPGSFARGGNVLDFLTFNYLRCVAPVKDLRGSFLIYGSP